MQLCLISESDVENLLHCAMLVVNKEYKCLNIKGNEIVKNLDVYEDG